MKYLQVRYKNGWKERQFVYWFIISIVTNTKKFFPFRIFIGLLGFELKLRFGEKDK